jgi:hypothetical protein
MKHFIIFLFTVTSVFAQSQFKTGDTITTQDKLRFLDSLNKYRILAGVEPLKYSFRQDILASLRIETILNRIESINETEFKSEILGHMHFNLRNDVVDFETNHIPLDSFIQIYGECSARLSKLSAHDDLVSTLFNGWKNSKEHWKIMLDSSYEYISLNWFIDNKKDVKFRKGTIASLVLIKYNVVTK